MCARIYKCRQGGGGARVQAGMLYIYTGNEKIHALVVGGAAGEAAADLGGRGGARPRRYVRWFTQAISILRH